MLQQHFQLKDLAKTLKVFQAFCGCPAGVDGRYNHVAATLFSLEEFCKVKEKKADTEEACTSKNANGMSLGSGK